MDGLAIADRARKAAVALALASLACGQASSTTSTSTPLPEPGPVASPPYYVTVTATGVTPQVTHLWQGRAVFFRNDDSRAHSLSADPHPSHLECFGRLNLGVLRPREVREITDMPVNACFFHSEEDPSNRAFWGVVVAH
jgi:hypothetical protein